LGPYSYETSTEEKKYLLNNKLNIIKWLIEYKIEPIYNLEEDIPPLMFLDTYYREVGKYIWQGVKIYEEDIPPFCFFNTNIKVGINIWQWEKFTKE
jgi:hypothetical protein